MQTISIYNLLYTLIPLALVWYFYYKWTDNKSEIIYATVRMIIQLLLVGYVLIYIFESKHPLIDSSILFFMIVISTWITLRNTENRSLKHFSLILISISLSGLFHLVFVIKCVLEFVNFFEPRYVIPIAGMVFANCMNILSICIERFEKEFVRNNDFEIARNISFKSALIPQINSFLAVGLVSLPGMMTGQILSGVDPLIAARYQIMIMAVILSSAGITLITYFLLKEKFFK